MKTLSKSHILIVVSMLLLSITACDEANNGSGPGTVNGTVAAPSDLRCYSEDGAVGLAWTRSSSENAVQFSGYTIKYLATGATDTLTWTINGSSSGTSITGLSNGVTYLFKVYARSTAGHLAVANPDSGLLWSPAAIRTVDANGNAINIYTIRSTSNSTAVDIYNANGQVERLNYASGEFQQRGNLYVYLEKTFQDHLEIRSPSLSEEWPGGVTEFSTVDSVRTNNFIGAASSAPPAAGTYTRSYVTITPELQDSGVLYFGRVSSGAGDYNYFRMLVVPGSLGALIQGSGNDRYLELQFSYQPAAGNVFAKR